MSPTLFLLGLLSLCATRSTEPPLPAHARALTPLAAGLLSTAIARSPTVRTLLDRLDGSDVVVYVKVGLAPPGVTTPASLSLVSAPGGFRYLMIWIDVLQNSPDDRIVWLAHELRHATEIASAGWVRDEESLRRFYESSGHRSDRRDHFETREAVQTAALARAELASSSLRR